MRFKGLTYFNEICFSCFMYTVTIRFNKFKRNEFHISSVMIVTQKMFGTVVGLELLACLSTGLRCSLERYLSRRLDSPMYCL